MDQGLVPRSASFRVRRIISVPDVLSLFTKAASALEGTYALFGGSFVVVLYRAFSAAGGDDGGVVEGPAWSADDESMTI